MTVVTSWTGGRADALRQALRMTIEDFAGHLGVAARTVGYWRARPDVALRPVTQQMLDVALARAPEQARAQFGLLLAERDPGQPMPATSSQSRVSDDVASLTAWITSSNTSDEAIRHIEQATVVLANMHAQVTARRVLTDVVQLHRKTQTLLRSGKQRLRQTRELIRIEGEASGPRQRPARRPGPGPRRPRYGKSAEIYSAARSRTSPAQACTRWPRQPGGSTTMPRQPTSPARLRGRPHQPDERPARLLRSQLCRTAGDSTGHKTALHPR